MPQPSAQVVANNTARSTKYTVQLRIYAIYHTAFDCCLDGRKKGELFEPPRRKSPSQFVEPLYALQVTSYRLINFRPRAYSAAVTPAW